jgi:hypothetical protein
MAWATTTTNVISVRGLSLGPDAGILTDEETVFAEVVDVTPTCLIQLISSADADGNPTDNRVQLPFTGKEHRVKVQVVVCNNSPVALKGVTIDPGELKCKKAGPFKLAPGQCLTNELCMRKVDCPDMPLTNLFTVTATLDVPNGLCASDVDGKRIAVRTQCDATIECLPEGPPGLTLTKTADTTTTSPGGKVIYDYTVRNTGQAVLTNVQVSDDNGTPEYSGDDLVVGTIGLLAPGESVTLSRDLYLPMRLCSEETGEQTGLLVAQTLATDNILVTFLQSLTVSDNTYGANAIGWGAAGGRSFQDLWHSDYAEFQFRNGGGDVVLQFRYDYLSPTAKEPSGYGTLGVSGGDGGIVVGNANRVIFVATSLSHQLNTVPFINQLPIYTVNSPALNDPLSRSWEYRTIYTAVIDRRAFGPSEFGSVSLIEAHNSPAKIPAFSITTCGGCVTNIAYVVGSFRDGSITNSADTVVCTTNRPFASCPLLPSYWAENSDRWLRYVSEQTVETVFIESGRHSNAPRRSLLQAIRGEAGLRPVRNLLEQAVAALLNAEAMGPGFPYSRRALVDTVNNALIDGSAATLAALTELLSAANDDENCAP